MQNPLQITSLSRHHIQLRSKPSKASYVNPLIELLWFSHDHSGPEKFLRDVSPSAGIGIERVALMTQSRRITWMSVRHRIAASRKALGRDARGSRLRPGRGRRGGRRSWRFERRLPRDSRYWTFIAHPKPPRCRSSMRLTAFSLLGRDWIVREYEA